MRLIAALLLLQITVCYASEEWSWVGPETGKYVSEIYGDPLHSLTWYAINDGELFRSTNNAKSWTSTGRRGGIIVHPISGKIWLFEIKQYVSVSISASTDQAKSFHPVSKLSHSYAFAISPLDDQILAAAEVTYGDDPPHLKISTDGGYTWNDVPEKLPLVRGSTIDGCQLEYEPEIWQTVFSPQDKNTLFIDLAYSDSCNRQSTALYVTHDLGKTWTLVAPSINRIWFELDPNFPDRIFAFTTLGAFELGNDSLLPLTAITFGYFVTYPENRNHLLGFARKTYESFDGGKHWHKNPNQLRFWPSLAMKTPVGGLLSATGFGGIYRKLPGDAWTAANHGFGNSSSALKVAAQGNAVYCVMEEGYVYRSMDRGNHWTDITQRVPKGYMNSIALNPQNPLEVLILVNVGRRYNNVSAYKSQDGGDHWHLIFKSHKLLGIRPSSITYDLNNPSTIYFAGNGIYRSTKGGLDPIEISDLYVSRVILDPLDPEFILAVGPNSGIWISKNGGRTFHEADGGIEVEDFDENGTEDAAAPSSHSYYFDITGRSAIYRSGNGGSSWSKISRFDYLGDGHGDPAGGQRIYPVDNSGMHLYITNGISLMETTNGGYQWKNLTASFFENYIYGYRFVEMTDPKQKPFYVATTNGLYRHD